jgi:hypothetical protein
VARPTRRGLKRSGPRSNQRPARSRRQVRSTSPRKEGRLTSVLLGADDGIRTSDPRLGKVARSMRLVSADAVTGGSVRGGVRPVRLISPCSGAVYSRPQPLSTPRPGQGSLHDGAVTMPNMPSVVSAWPRMSPPCTPGLASPRERAKHVKEH